MSTKVLLTVVLAASANDAVVALEIDSTSSEQSAPLAVCAGEGPRYGDYKCNHDGTHRVCAHLKTQQGIAFRLVLPSNSIASTLVLPRYTGALFR